MAPTTTSEVTVGSGARDRILAAAIDVIESRGEAALRMADIARNANVAIGLVGHYFGGRDGLVAAAHAERFRGSVLDDLGRLTQIMNERPTRSDARSALRTLTRELIGADRSPQRMTRIAALGAAHGRPDLSERLGATAGEMLDVLTAIVSVAQADGLMRDDLEPRAVATLIQGYALGLVLADIDPRAVSTDAIADVVDAALDSLLLIPREGDSAP